MTLRYLDRCWKHRCQRLDSGAVLFLEHHFNLRSVAHANDLKLIGSEEGDWTGRTVLAIPSADRNSGDWAVSSSWNDTGEQYGEGVDSYW